VSPVLQRRGSANVDAVLSLKSKNSKITMALLILPLKAGCMKFHAAFTVREAYIKSCNVPVAI